MTPYFYFVVRYCGSVVGRYGTQQVAVNHAMDLVDEGFDPKKITINRRTIEL